MKRKPLLLILMALLCACRGVPAVEAAPTITEAPAAAPAVATAEPSAEPTPEPVPTPGPTSVPSPTPIPVTPPVITLTGGENITVDADFTFEDPGAAAVDCLGRDLTSRILTEGRVIPYLVGEYELIYTVSDDYGNETSVRRQVTVKAVDVPDIVMPPPKTVYLTFDDGPGAATAYLLDILKEYDVKATFFVVGKQSRKELIRRAYEEGHSIGVHSYTHTFDEVYASEEAFFADFLATQEVIREQTGQYTPIFRFPGGSGNTASAFNKGIISRLAKIMEDMGYRYFDWNVNSLDASGREDMAILDYYNVVRNRILSNGETSSVVLQHDINSTSVRSVEYIIRWGLENGYTFLPLDMTSPVVHAHINN